MPDERRHDVPSLDARQGVRVVIPLADANVAPSPASRRLSRIAPLSDADLRALRAAEAEATLVPVRRELLTLGKPIAGARILLSGWAAGVTVLPDGRRQFLNMLLPGDLVGYHGHARPIAPVTVVALTDVTIAPAPPGDEHPALREAYEVSRALDSGYLLAQVLRLGRMNAQERIADFVLELRERLDLAGLVTADGFDAPLTQESLGDALGLTSVHINRTLRSLRFDGDLIWKGGRITMPNPAGLAAKIGRTPVRIAADR
jgi:CRP-like cAMP-binding protein